MAKTSAGLLMFRLRNGEPEVLLVHPGGPFWAKKVVHAWAVEGDCDPAQLHSNLFSLEWPPKSGKQQQFPEVDRAEWFSVRVALQKIIPAQRWFVAQLVTIRGTDREATSRGLRIARGPDCCKPESMRVGDEGICA